MFPKEYRSRDVISLYYGGEIIASNKVNQVIEDALKSDKERKFVETIEVAINLRDVDLQNPQKRINAEVALPHGRGRPSRVAVFAQGEMAVISKKIVDTVLGPDQIDELSENKSTLIIQRRNLVIKRTLQARMGSCFACAKLYTFPMVCACSRAAE